MPRGHDAFKGKHCRRDFCNGRRYLPIFRVFAPTLPKPFWQEHAMPLSPLGLLDRVLHGSAVRPGPATSILPLQGLTVLEIGRAHV